MLYDIDGNEIRLNDYIPLEDIALTSASRYSSINKSGIQSAFITPSGKVWMVTTSQCFVVNDGTLAAEITLDHSVGHANSANYDNGFAYVSDWTDGQTIHVFAVDDANNTMTWTKDITVPTTHGRTQFWVFDNENQIYSCGWNYEHSGNSQYMVIELWKKGGDGVYVQAWESVVTGISVAQGMCVHQNRLYIIDDTIDYKHQGIVVIDLSSGQQIHNSSQSGTILTLETEALIPVADDRFVVVTYNGAQFTLTGS